MQTPMDVVNDRRWLVSCNPRATLVGTIGPRRRSNAQAAQALKLKARTFTYISFTVKGSERFNTDTHRPTR